MTVGPCFRKMRSLQRLFYLRKIWWKREEVLTSICMEDTISGILVSCCIRYMVTVHMGEY
jgi:hypothetical protein